MKFGLAVTGIVDPNRIISNAGAQEGDCLFLTKALGTGIITTAIKRNAVGPELERLVTQQMATLNRAAAELMVRHRVHAATDITGFGLLGHAFEMAAASEVSIRLHVGALPILPDAVRLADEGYNPGGANDNREYLRDKVSMDPRIARNVECVLYDPQTSGGLLIAVSAAQARAFGADLAAIGLPGAVVGHVTKSQSTPLQIDSD